ncbi:prospero homeobox protein 1 [Silurus meridionalis]|nr:prospero homeobox protein 1 [Silurus meridionalis]
MRMSPQSNFRAGKLKSSTVQPLTPGFKVYSVKHNRAPGRTPHSGNLLRRSSRQQKPPIFGYFGDEVGHTQAFGPDCSTETPVLGSGGSFYWNLPTECEPWPLRNGSIVSPGMPDHDSESLLNRQTKRRRVDIGVKRTVGSTSTLTSAASTDFIPSRASKSAIIFRAMNSHHSTEQDLLDCQGVQLGHGDSSESKSNVLRKLLKRANSYEDTMMPFPGATIISQLLKSNMAKNGAGGGVESGFPSSALSSTGSEVPQEDACSNSSQESPQECLSPFSRPTLGHFDVERLNDEHLRAKRARVENIIRGMSHSPNVMMPSNSSSRERERDGEGEPEGPHQPPSPREGYRENKRKQKLPQQQHSFQQLVSVHKEQKVEERRQLKLQLEDMQKQLRQLQEKFFQIYDSTDSEGNDPDHDGGNLSEDSARSDAGLMDGDGDERPMRDSAADRSDNEMSDLDPGHFLDRARALLREQALLDGEKPKRESSLRGKGPTSMHAEGKQLAETLKQELNSAMSQVVDTVVKVFAKPPRPLPQVFPPLPPPQERFTVNGDNPNFHTTNQRLQCFGDVIIPSPHESFGGVPLPSANDQTEALPLVEGLSPNHLKKAKLMFFYTRYPSSNMLKMFFADVKFNRCITSQLIKWFSNFREFYYIQMEKFARQAINDGVTGTDEMSVSRDSELFRALNMHYNKANDFETLTGSCLCQGDWRTLGKDESANGLVSSLPPCYTPMDPAKTVAVPERFLEVAQITLREFFNAIVAGKDVDPSWKKAIYKVICKLDSEVPEIFKSPNCLQELLHE